MIYFMVRYAYVAVMLFDAPGSVSNPFLYLFVLVIVALPVTCTIAAIGPFAADNNEYYLLPLVHLSLLVVLFFLLSIL